MARNWSIGQSKKKIEKLRKKGRKRETNCKDTHKLKLKCKHKHTDALRKRRWFDDWVWENRGETKEKGKIWARCTDMQTDRVRKREHWATRSIERRWQWSKCGQQQKTRRYYFRGRTHTHKHKYRQQQKKLLADKQPGGQPAPLIPVIRQCVFHSHYTHVSVSVCVRALCICRTNWKQQRQEKRGDAAKTFSWQIIKKMIQRRQQQKAKFHLVAAVTGPPRTAKPPQTPSQTPPYFTGIVIWCGLFFLFLFFCSLIPIARWPLLLSNIFPVQTNSIDQQQMYSSSSSNNVIC